MHLTNALPRFDVRANEQYGPSPTANQSRNEAHSPKPPESITAGKRTYSQSKDGLNTKPDVFKADTQLDQDLHFIPPGFPIEDVDPRLMQYIHSKSYHSESEITNSMLLHGYPSATDLLKQRASPTESKDYHDTSDNANRPVRREHFNEFKAAHEEHDSRLRYSLLQTRIERELAHQEAMKWENKCRGLEKTTEWSWVMGHQYDASAWIQRQRGVINEPCVDERAEQSPSNGDHFLWKNILDKLQETHVNILILRASAMWTVEDWQMMELQTDEAIKQALKLDYNPLVARCMFYKGVAEYEQRQWAQACASFVDALACHGIYPEGYEVAKWMEKAGAAQLNSPATSNTFYVGEPTLSPSPRDLRMSDGFSDLPAGYSGEHPPELDDEDEEEVEAEESVEIDSYYNL